jgi:hypothetical protein
VELAGAVAAATVVASIALAPLEGQQTSAKASATAAAPSRTPYKVPRTADGQPDLQGVWANNNITPLERPKQLGERQYLTPEEMQRLKVRAETLFAGDGDAAFGDEIFAAALSDREKYVADSFDKDTGNYNSFWIVGREFDNRTSLITDPPDGRVPPLTAAAQKRFADQMAGRRGRGAADSHEDRPLTERCLTYGLPDTLAGYNSYFQFSQSKNWVALHTERIHDTRLIAIDGRPHLSSNLRLWNGDSRGRWEGDTLVVETRNLDARSAYRGSSDNLRLTEKFTRVNDNTLNYEITLDDPTTWTRPWSLMIPLKKSKDRIYEYACHEGNYGIVGVLAGARAKEKTPQK